MELSEEVRIISGGGEFSSGNPELNHLRCSYTPPPDTEEHRFKSPQQCVNSIVRQMTNA